MSEHGWTYKRLGEVCVDKKQIVRASNLFLPNEIINYIDISSIDNSQNVITSTTPIIFDDAPSRAQQVVKIGDVLISLVRPNLRNVAIVNSQNDNLVASSGFCILRTEGHVNNRYIFYIVKGDKFTNYLLSRVQGANYPAVREDDIKNYLLPVPPMAEQERIVAELDLLSGIIEKKKEQLKAYDQLAQSIFYTMFGDPIDNPKGWEVKHLGEVCDFINGFAFKSDLFKNNGLPILRISNIQNNVVNEEGMVYFSPTDYREDFTKYSVNKGDIVIAMSGATTGKLGVYLGERTCYLNQRVGKFQVKSEDRITNKLLLYYLRTISKQILTDAMGVAQPNISSKQIKEYTIILPPLSLQQEFAEKVEAIERQKALVQQSIDETQTMFDYTMDKYFG